MEKPSLQADEVYEEIASSILDAVESSDKTTRMPWNGIHHSPNNPITGKRFSGTNMISLWAAMRNHQYESPYWASERAWKSRGGKLKPTAQGTNIFMPIFDETISTSYRSGPLGFDHQNPKDKRLLGFKKWLVYNYEEVSHIRLPDPSSPHPFTPIDAADKLIESYLSNKGPALIFGGAIACYIPLYDRIQMPPKESFPAYDGLDGNQYYYSVTLHECIHSTGSPNRLNRLKNASFGSASYAEEELIAELGCAFVGSRIGLATALRLDHASYVKSWLSLLKNQRSTFFKAANQGAKAANFLLEKSNWNANETGSTALR